MQLTKMRQCLRIEALDHLLKKYGKRQVMSLQLRREIQFGGGPTIPVEERKPSIAEEKVRDAATDGGGKGQRCQVEVKSSCRL